MGEILGYLIGIPLLLFAAYLMIAIPYSTIVKPIFRGVTKAPKIFKDTSAKLQRANIQRTLKRLVKAMEEGAQNKLKHRGKLLKSDLDKVTKIQKELLSDMIGPLSKSEIKKELFNIYLNDQKLSKDTKIGLEHVLNNFK